MIQRPPLPAGGASVRSTDAEGLSWGNGRANTVTSRTTGVCDDPTISRQRMPTRAGSSGQRTTVTALFARHVAGRSPPFRRRGSAFSSRRASPRPARCDQMGCRSPAPGRQSPRPTTAPRDHFPGLSRSDSDSTASGAGSGRQSAGHRLRSRHAGSPAPRRPVTSPPRLVFLENRGYGGILPGSPEDERTATAPAPFRLPGTALRPVCVISRCRR